MSEKIVLVTDHTWPSTAPEAEVLARVGARLVEAQSGDEDELLALVENADAILTCFARVTDRVIRAGGRLQVVGRCGIGVDNIAVDEATRLGIPVTNVPAYCLDEVAEHALALLLSFARGICAYNNAVRKGNWELTTGMPMFRVAGRTLGIVGFGKIGQTVALKARGLGLEVLAFDPHLPAAAVRERGAEPASLEDLAERSDFVSVHTPLNSETEGLIDERFLGRMKPAAFLINTARGGIIDQDALLRALEERRIAGAGIDVFIPERLPPDHPLLAQDSLIATPHVAFCSDESVRELQTRAADNVAAILSGRRPEAIVNPEVLELDRWAHLV